MAGALLRAPKLTGNYHVYGITRRGFGDSSHPRDGYSADRLGDDVLTVLDTLKIQKPVLVGHSIAGEELSAVAVEHPERISAVIYLDAAYSFAYYDPKLGDFNLDLQELRGKLDQVAKHEGKPKEMVASLLDVDLPRFSNDLRKLQKDMNATPPSETPGPKPSDLASFSSYRKWQARAQNLTFPEAELRQQFGINADGSVGQWLASDKVEIAIEAGQKKFPSIPIPALAIFSEVGDDAKAFERGNPRAEVVTLQKANHYVFLSNEAKGLHAMESFISGLR